MTAARDPVFLIWGANGWIAGLLKQYLEQQGKNVFATAERMQDRQAVMNELKKYKPTHVLNCAGQTGRPNVDWCEDNKEATIRSNVIGTLNLTDCCWEMGIHITVFATGCIYQYDDAHPPGGTPFKETDPANFGGSFYSYTKSRVEEIMQSYPNCLILRLRMPVSDDLHPRSFVTKITRYAHVVDIPNSTTMLHDLVPVAVALAEHGETGVYNFCNPGAISHNEVLGLYRDIVDPAFAWRNFSLHEQKSVVKAGRSNCELDPEKLVRKCREFGIRVPEVKEAYRACFERMKRGMEMQQKAGAQGL